MYLQPHLSFQERIERGVKRDYENTYNRRHTRPRDQSRTIFSDERYFSRNVSQLRGWTIQSIDKIL